MTGSDPSRPDLSVWGLTDTGRVRSENQDTFVALGLSAESPGEDLLVAPELASEDARLEHRFDSELERVLLLVADGMGGVQGGATASALAAEAIVRKVKGDRAGEDGADAEWFATRLERAIQEANEQVRARAAEDPGLRGMGTTLTAVGLLGRTFVCAQVGDSRAYRFRNGRLEQLTRDQTVVQELVDAGTMSAEEAKRSDQRNMILQALGSTDELDVVISHHELDDADTLLLCSDGLSGVLDEESLADVLTRAGSPREACEALVRRANDAGGPDNITVLIGTVRKPGGDLADTLSS